MVRNYHMLPWKLCQFSRSVQICWRARLSWLGENHRWGQYRLGGKLRKNVAYEKMLHEFDATAFVLLHILRSISLHCSVRFLKKCQSLLTKSMLVVQKICLTLVSHQNFTQIIVFQNRARILRFSASSQSSCLYPINDWRIRTKQSA